MSVRENQNTATSLPAAATTAVSLELAVEAKNRRQTAEELTGKGEWQEWKSGNVAL